VKNVRVLVLDEEVCFELELPFCEHGELPATITTGEAVYVRSDRPLYERISAMELKVPDDELVAPA
jgi:hypothetical protein